MLVTMVLKENQDVLANKGMLLVPQERKEIEEREDRRDNLVKMDLLV